MSAVQEKNPESPIVVPAPSYSKRDEVATTTPPSTLMQALAAAAADPRMEVDKVERLWAMHKEMMDREREALFNEAMSRAQATIVPIARDRHNDHTKSWYATLAAINESVTPIYSAEGLAVSFDTYNPARDEKEMGALEKGWHRVVAIVSHKSGHSRKYHLDAPLDDAGVQGTKNKTGIQGVGSTVSYLRRYLVCMIFNVATQDDNDGNSTKGASGKRMPENQLADFLAMIESAADEHGLMRDFGKAWNSAEDLKDKDAQRQLMGARDLKRKALRQVRR